MQSLAHLQSLCIPPTELVDPLDAKEWNLRFRALGTRLPEQLVRLNATYGSGIFESVQSPINASFSISGSTVSAHTIGRLAELRLAKLKRPKAFPALLYFEPGGLLPIGTITPGIDICFRTDGDNPDRWRISLLRATTNQVQHLDSSLHQALSGLLDGSLHSALFSKHLPSLRGYRFKPFRESVQQWHAG